MTTTDTSLTAQSAVEGERCSCVETITAAGATATDCTVYVNAPVLQFISMVFWPVKQIH